MSNKTVSQEELGKVSRVASGRLLGRSLALSAGLVLLAAPIGQAAMVPAPQAATAATPVAAATNALPAPLPALTGTAGPGSLQVHTAALAPGATALPAHAGVMAGPGHRGNWPDSAPAPSLSISGSLWLAAGAVLALALARKPRATPEAPTR